jgi:hypothetical protein
VNEDKAGAPERLAAACGGKGRRECGGVKRAADARTYLRGQRGCTCTQGGGLLCKEDARCIQ